MTLSEWLESTETTQVQLAEATGIDQALISKYALGRCMPKIPQARKIAEATDNAVPIESWGLPSKKAKRTKAA